LQKGWNHDGKPATVLQTTLFDPTIRDVHYGTFRLSGIFISNPEYQIPSRSNYGLVKRYASVYTCRYTPDPLQLTAFSVSG